MVDTALAATAGPALVELLPRVLHESPAAVLLVDLGAGKVTYANRQAMLMAPDLRLPMTINDWSRAAGLCDPDGVPAPPPTGTAAAGPAGPGPRHGPAGYRQTDIDAGVARLCALVAGHDPTLGVSTLCDRLLDELITGPRADDAAVVAVRIADDWGRR